MRHGNTVNKLGRTQSHRKALMANLAKSLIKHKRIQTTLAKAKALRRYIEPLITKSKSDTTHARRVIFAYLGQKEAVRELFAEIAPKLIERAGGYTRILKLGPRLGDNAEMALIELVDFNDYLPSNLGADKKPRRRRQAKKKPGAKGEAAAPAAEATPAAE